MRYPLVDKTQLFDLSQDPHELNNLADKPEYADKLAELMDSLRQEMLAHADPHPLTVSQPRPAAWSPPNAEQQPNAAGKRSKKNK